MIDEKMLIEDIEKEFDGVCVYDVSPTQAASEFVEIVERQPKVGEWIPCSFDAPDDNQIVVVSTIDGGIHIATFHIAKGKNYCWYLFETGGMFTSPYVTAWLPLPEAYKGEK